MRIILFTLALCVPIMAAAQPSHYTNCNSYGSRMQCEHGQKQQGMGRIQAINPSQYQPKAAPLPNRNPFLDGVRQAQEQELLDEQIRYYRNLNRQSR